MKDEPLPDTDHISRYCPFGSLLDGGEVTGTSFLLRRDPKREEEYLSVNWLEHLRLDNRTAEIAEVRRVLSTKRSLGGKAKIAVLNVGNTKDNVRQKSPDRRDLRILHRPNEPPEFPDPSHSGIFDTLLDEQLVAELIAESVKETYPTR